MFHFFLQERGAYETGTKSGVQIIKQKNKHTSLNI